jgi:hypothetical protein
LHLKTGVGGNEVPVEEASGEDENSTPSIELDWLEVDGMEENIFDDMAMMLASQG